MGTAHSSAISMGGASNADIAQILAFVLEADSNTVLISDSSLSLGPCVCRMLTGLVVKSNIKASLCKKST